MSRQGTVILYHGTDWESALDILNNGLNVERLLNLQTQRSIQMGPGWYTTEQINVAWFFASTALRSFEHGFTVIEMEIHIEHLESLFEQGLAIKNRIVNVLFEGEQVWFALDAFEFLNQHALFRPYQEA